MLDAIRDAEDGLVSVPYGDVREQLKRHWSSLEAVVDARFTIVELSVNGAVFDLATMDVKGLVDYGSAMWADPLFGDCFIGASEDFAAGYGASDGSGSDGKVRRLL